MVGLCVPYPAVAGAGATAYPAACPAWYAAPVAAAAAALQKIPLDVNRGKNAKDNVYY